MNLFDGLEIFGFKEVKYDDIFKKNVPKKKEEKVKKSVSVLNPEDCLYKKLYECKVCGAEFKETTIRRTKIRYVSSESDLKPHYDPVEPMIYDVVLCPNCGYASILSLFNKVSDRQADLIQQKITSKFKAKEYPLVLTVDMAIERYKLALLNTLARSGKSGEKAYICLKLAWMYRDKADKKNELLFLENAYSGFVEAYSTEEFPIFGIDEPTLSYMIGEMARRLGRYSEAMRWISNVIKQRNISPRLKERAMDIKDLIKEDISHASQRP